MGKAGQLFQFDGAERRQRTADGIPHRFIERPERGGAGGGDIGPDDPAILHAAPAADVPAPFEAVQ